MWRLAPPAVTHATAKVTGSSSTRTENLETWKAAAERNRRQRNKSPNSAIKRRGIKFDCLSDWDLQ